MTILTAAGVVFLVLAAAVTGFGVVWAAAALLHVLLGEKRR